VNIVADENIAFAREFFAPLGDLRLLPGRGITAADVRDADVLLVRSVTDVNAALLQGSAVKFVGSCTIGTDHVDTAWLAEHNIRFAYAPGCNANAVVEYVLSALLALEVDLSSKKIGIVGCGNVGGRLLRCLQKNGAAVCGYDPFLQNSDLPLVRFADILQCDVICLHTPLTRTGAFPTFHLFNAEVINALKPGTLLLNAGRGAAIDNRALLQRLHEKDDLLTVLDVWENEPAIDPALLAAVTIGTPHIAGYSAEGKLRGTEMIHSALCQFLGTEYLGTQPVIPGIRLDGEITPYAVLADDAALRTRFPVDGALAFDRLRKLYVARREGGFPHLLAPDQSAH
jgi:erythronate-4-phosphate dehydrogenase